MGDVLVIVSAVRRIEYDSQARQGYQKDNQHGTWYHVLTSTHNGSTVVVKIFHILLLLVGLTLLIFCFFFARTFFGPYIQEQ